MAASKQLFMLTDAKHGWHKNSRQTNVNCLGSKTKNALHIKAVETKVNDLVAQCHEQLETHEIYAKLDSAGVDVRMHQSQSSSENLGLQH